VKICVPTLETLISDSDLRSKGLLLFISGSILCLKILNRSTHTYLYNLVVLQNKLHMLLFC